MKVVFPLIKTRPGGVDVYIKYLEKMNDYGVAFTARYYSHKFEIIPNILKNIRVEFTEFDIVHTNLENAFVFRDKNKPLVVTSHHLIFDSDYQQYTSLKQKLYHRFVLKNNIKKSLKLADYIITVSEFTKNQLVEFFDVKCPVVVIPNGIDTTEFKPAYFKRNNDKIRLLFVGNLIKRKGADLLPKIMRELGDNFELTIISGLDINKNISIDFPNILIKQGLSTEQLIEEYNRCDIFLFPSRLEGFGYTVAEAMSCGKPCIVTNCSALPELIDDGKGGFLCDIDDVDKFVERIKFLSEDCVLRNKMGQYNREKILQKFSIHQFIKKNIGIYYEIIGQN